MNFKNIIKAHPWWLISFYISCSISLCVIGYFQYEGADADKQFYKEQAQLKALDGFPLTNLEWDSLIGATNTENLFTRIIDNRDSLGLHQVMREIKVTHTNLPACVLAGQVGVYKIVSATPDAYFFGANTVYAVDFTGEKLPGWSIASNADEYILVATCIASLTYGGVL